MYEIFTDRARNVIQLASQEAQRFNHEYIGTETLLLGLIKEGSGGAASVLRKLGLDLRNVRLEVEKIVQTGPDKVTIDQTPHTPRAKKVIEYAIEEARSLGHHHVGTEHLLLGLLRETEGVAAQVLMNMGLKLEGVRQEAISLLGPTGQSPSEAVPEPMAVTVDAVKLQEELNKVNASRALRQSAAKLVTVIDQFSAAYETRIKALERQLATVRFLLGGMLGAGSGVVLGDRLGLVVGLLAGCGLAWFGRIIPAGLAGGIAGGVIGAGQFGGDVGGVAGAAVGALLAGAVTEIGRERKV
jgi:ATP-dependent Clp protease ATP-binding subunit ClpA